MVRATARPPSESRRDVVERAIEVFVRGFAFARSFTHPFAAERVGPVWVVRDAPRKNAADYRVEEYVAFGVPPEEVDHFARRHARGRFAVCAVRAVDEDDGPLRAAYKRLGYRLRATEPQFVHRLARVPRVAVPAGVGVVRVLDEDLANKLAKAAGRAQIRREHFARGAPLRQYVALDDETPVGWVRSITVSLNDGDAATWCSNMHVQPAHRRRGIGRAMLAHMLRDDRAARARFASLLATHTGAMLYPRVGYEQVGELLLYSPVKR